MKWVCSRYLEQKVILIDIKTVPVGLVTTDFNDKYNHGSVTKVHETTLIWCKRGNFLEI